MTQEHNPISSPSHYTAYGVQPIAITRYLGFCLGNVVKYVLRAPYKGNPVQDLQKALQYLEWEKESPLDNIQKPSLSRIDKIKNAIRDLQIELAQTELDDDMAKMVVDKTKFFLVDLYDYLFVVSSPRTLDSMIDTINSILKLYELDARGGE